MDIFHTLIQSFGVPEAYKRVAFQWGILKTFLYFLLLSLIAAISVYIVARPILEQFYEENVIPSISILEKIKIEDGKVVIPDNKEIDLKTKTGEVYAIVSDKFIEPSRTKNLVFSVEKDRICLYSLDGEETFFSLKELTDTYPFENLSQIFPPKSLLIDVILPIFLVFFVFIKNGFYSLVLSMAAWIMSQSSMPSLGWFRCFKIAIISLTPPLLLDIILGILFKSAIPEFVFALISCGIIWYIMKVFRNSQISKNPADTVDLD